MFGGYIHTYKFDEAVEDGVVPEVLLQDRLAVGRERLESAFETLHLLCESVEPPQGELEQIHYFCGNTDLADDLAAREPRRVMLYKGVAVLMRAYAAICDELELAGYSPDQVAAIKRDLRRYLDLREIVRHASGETIDLKAYEADMRHLIDTYIEADEPRVVSPFEEMTLIELIVKSGLGEAISKLPEGLKGNQRAVDETIANNVRRKIIKEHLNDPAFYDAMSHLLDEILADLRARQIEYAEFLRRVAEIAATVQAGQGAETLATLDTPGKRALYNNLGQNEELALRVDEAVKANRPDGWRGVYPREQVVKRAIHDVVQDEYEVERVFPIVKQQREY